MSRPAPEEQAGSLASELAALEDEVEGFREGRSALARLVERERELREQARAVSSRDWELAAARQELNQHERGFAEELEALVADQLASPHPERWTVTSPSPPRYEITLSRH